MTLILKDNSVEIRKEIIDAGIAVCPCAEFHDACWLDYRVDDYLTKRVHGVGYFDYGVDGITSQAEELERFLEKVKDPYICKDVDEFIEKIKEMQKK